MSHTDRFRLNSHSDEAHKLLDLSANFPLAPGATMYTEEIPAGGWAERGFEIKLNDLNCQIKIVVETSHDKRDPRTYHPIFHPVLSQPLEFTIASTATDPGILGFVTDFRGDWIRFSIENTGANPITDLEFVAILAHNLSLN